MNGHDEQGREETPRPSSRRLGKAAISIVAILIACIVVLFVARNIWHGEEQQEDEVTGDSPTQHTPPNFVG